MEVHADILRMTKTRDKRECIKWFHARRLFFGRSTMRDGFELARESEHPDARFFVSLLPRGPPANYEEARGVFLANQSDARCLTWAATSLFGERPMAALLLQGARAQCTYGEGGDKQLDEWLEYAVERGEIEAMENLAWRVYQGVSSPDEERAKRLWRKGALLGCPFAQGDVGLRCCDEDSWERYAWLRRSGMQSYDNTLVHACLIPLPRLLSLHDEGGSGRAVFEIGHALSLMEEWRYDVAEDLKLIGEGALLLFEQ